MAPVTDPDRDFDGPDRMGRPSRPPVAARTVDLSEARMVALYECEREPSEAKPGAYLAVAESAVVDVAAQR